MTDLRACPAYWISLIPDQVQQVECDSILLVCWYCRYCDRWHADLTDLNHPRKPTQTLICPYDGEPTTWLNFVVQNDIPHCLAYWWRCTRCQSWHLNLIKTQNGESTCSDTPTP